MKYQLPYSNNLMLLMMTIMLIIGLFTGYWIGYALAVSDSYHFIKTELAK